MTLSEKAKGKQRAVEPQSGNPEPPKRDLVIRFTEGIPDLTLQIAEKDVVRDVKNKIRDARPQLHDRRLRLILSGQLLAESTPLYNRLTTLEQQHRRAASENDANSVGSKVQNANNIWLHCSVGPQMTDGEEEEHSLQTAQLKPLRGFDRLAAAGFSEQDIANIRLQFHAHSAGDYIDQDFESDEDFDEHARALEEQWIDSFDNGGTPLSQSSSRATSMLLNGVVPGFFFPLIPFFFFRSPKPAVFWDDGSELEATSSVIFSRRLQMGIVVGFLLNAIFGIWTYLLTSP
ncbi:uncharacterized protein LAESUDRAFT_647550 [Laetiporus sulphureus 93-53]|uniref:Ubiquitin-like domain-containing protein n=1 Tax=Laetiporus sulphureus 93-53 TaxID=1314785 RepID=A0A165FM54_9APHY|nr:uncharacterized protein LAESUDRAFT_647550 [Laetiporus sulphureus 93-53]KZT09180.1 hypothetical protein LAESUDRAFT_647550 [Laetiporus sulphureus 93-53]